MINRLRKFTAQCLLPTAVCSLVFASCGRSVETESLCLLSTRWNLASTQVATILVDLESAPPGQIREAMSEVVATLIALNNVAPREISTEIDLLLNTFGSLSDALEALDWDGSASKQDAAVTSSGVRLASEEIQRSQTDLANFFEDSCSVSIDNPINQFPNVGTTLPDPVIQEDDSPEPSASFDNDETIARAFGYVVVERFGVAITDAQANCVGLALLAATSSDASIVDLTYWQMLQSIFDSCEVRIDVAKALENE